MQCLLNLDSFEVHVSLIKCINKINIKCFFFQKEYEEWQKIKHDTAKYRIFFLFKDFIYLTGDETTKYKMCWKCVLMRFFKDILYFEAILFYLRRVCLSYVTFIQTLQSILNIILWFNRVIFLHIRKWDFQNWYVKRFIGTKNWALGLLLYSNRFFLTEHVCQEHLIKCFKSQKYRKLIVFVLNVTESQCTFFIKFAEKSCYQPKR